MDALLAKLGVQAVNYAMRCGIALTSSFAIQQCSRLLKTVDDKGLYKELKYLQKTLNSKIKIISPALDLIEFRSGRGNVFLGNAVSLAKALHRDIVALGKRLEQAAAAEEVARLAGSSARTAEKHRAELLLIIADIKNLLARLDGDIPLIQLAITASGESLSASMPPGISPSRLLQASMFLMFGDTQFISEPNRPVQIGPSFTLSLYMLFLGHAPNPADRKDGQGSGPATPDGSRHRRRHLHDDDEEPYGIEEGERKPIWQEVLHKSRARICRTPLDWEFDHERGYRPRGAPALYSGDDFDPGISLIPFGRADEYAYHLEIIEDLDDGRAHDDEEANQARPYDDVARAGIRESIPIHQISKIFYTNTGRILNIGNATDFENNPVLLLKRDINAPAPSRSMEHMMPQQEEDEAILEEGPPESDSLDSDEQADIDRQLRAESEAPAPEGKPEAIPGRAWHLPPHLDPEWLAFEVFVEDEDEDEEDEADEGSEEGDEEPLGETGQVGPPPSSHHATPTKHAHRSSLDSRLIAQIRNISIRSSPGPAGTSSRPSSSRGGTGTVPSAVQGASTSNNNHLTESPDSFVARSPFGAITSSLSLLEMLVRLTSLQEFQQASHLSIPDHVLTFFLEETSTTGLPRGEGRWRLRNEARRRVGFDPYTDTPTKQ